MSVTAINVEEEALLHLQRPSHFMWFGDDEMFVTWGLTSLYRRINGGSEELINQSNLDVIFADLNTRFPECVRLESISHDVAGPLEQMSIQVLDVAGGKPTAAFAAYCEWTSKLEDYPLANEDHLSELEYEDALDTFDMLVKYVDLREDLTQEQLSTLFSHVTESGYTFNEDDILEEATHLGWVSD
ncbi:MAG: hypothetical protein ACR2KZ_14660 [Segetibacter sp.]